MLLLLIGSTVSGDPEAAAFLKRQLPLVPSPCDPATKAPHE
jgi:hypothetical protein